MELIDLWKAREVEALGSLAPKPAAEEPAAADAAAEEPAIDESEIQTAKEPPDLGSGGCARAEAADPPRSVPARPAAQMAPIFPS
jgi:hypothetical protein